MALKQGNVATFRATSQRYREDICQRHDVRAQRRDVPEDVTKQRCDVGYQRRDVLEDATNQRRDVGFPCRDVPEMFKINARRWELKSRRSRGTQNQRRDVRFSHRDFPEKGKIDVATLRPNVATL